MAYHSTELGFHNASTQLREIFLLNQTRILTSEDFQQVCKVYWRQAEAQQVLDTMTTNMLLQSVRKRLVDWLRADEEKR